MAFKGINASRFSMTLGMVHIVYCPPYWPIGSSVMCGFFCVADREYARKQLFSYEQGTYAP